ncbi:MAG: type II toxin-antitoxin system HipA family toxin [Fibrobacterota bacterium]|nr:type II toxin-antitoxin system HipA family toxin [Fibrobacterota bacterium]QQS06599.1 MAG: type II toxin-antitoxin system HipA family toxin [Fibrobacterota bacterium]
MECLIETHTPSGWKRIGSWMPDPGSIDRGIAGGGRWSYDVDWVVEHFDEPWEAVSLALPLGFDSVRLAHWPSFLVDLLPSGMGRDQWRALLALHNGPAADWPLLQHAGRAPVGRLRLAHAHQWTPDAVRGFSREEVLGHGGQFLEFMRESQATDFSVRNDSPYSAADTQGAAPKYLLTQDRNGLWWAEGTLPDDRCQKFWLVKFPRGRNQIDRTILRAERAGLEIARAWGLDCAEGSTWERDCLFVPRFDRIVEAAGVRRLGLESLCSAMGVAEYGVKFRHTEICNAIARFSTDPASDLLEYLARDVLNLALGNTDNHARNTSFLKNGRSIRLSPLYDVAPMEMDPEGILRATRWDGESHLRPDWNLVADTLAAWIDRHRILQRMESLAASVRELPVTTLRTEMPPEVIAHCALRWSRLAVDLESAT